MPTVVCPSCPSAESGVPGGALDLAIALHRVPSMRGALRDRPLPDGVDELLTLVGGAPAVLARASAQCGEPPATVLEAARFFVQEVLLFPRADAYRVLGLDAAANDRQIKAHYRALQHWLHPDRRGNDLESAYATRINGAWAQLRTPERRRRYDQAHADLAQVSAVVVHAERVRLSGWRSAAAPTDERRSIALALTVLALCLWLAWIATREPPAAQGIADELSVAIDGTQGNPKSAAPEANHRESMPRPPQAQSSPKTDASQPEPTTAATARIPATAQSVTSARAAGHSVATEYSDLQLPGPDIRRIAAPTEPARASSATLRSSGALATGAEPRDLPANQDAASSDALARGQSADRLASELWSYLAGRRTTPPPIWRDASALDDAGRVRRDLAELARLHGGQVAFSEARWHVGTESAQVRVGVDSGRGGPGPGNAVQARLGWRAGTWWVEQVAWEQEP